MINIINLKITDSFVALGTEILEVKIFVSNVEKKLLRDCGLPNIRFLNLRTNHCTLLLKNNLIKL